MCLNIFTTSAAKNASGQFWEIEEEAAAEEDCHIFFNMSTLKNKNKTGTCFFFNLSTCYNTYTGTSNNNSNNVLPTNEDTINPTTMWYARILLLGGKESYPANIPAWLPWQCSCLQTDTTAGQHDGAYGLPRFRCTGCLKMYQSLVHTPAWWTFSRSSPKIPATKMSHWQIDHRSTKQVKYR